MFDQPKNPKQFEGVFVKQGNGNGKSILFGEQAILYTHDLIDCIAIMIVTDTHCILIHSDANNNRGIGNISLEEAIRDFGLTKDTPCLIGLAGGNSNLAIANKATFIQNLLPNANICFKKSMSDGAYLVGTGEMADTKKYLKTILNLNDLNIIDRIVVNDKIFKKD